MIHSERIKLSGRGMWVVVHSIPKGNGNFREVYAPSPKLKRELQDRVPRLTVTSMILDKHSVAHAFMPGRNPVTNAAAHIGFEYTLSLDLVDCFHHCTKRILVDMVKNIDLCFLYINDRQVLPQGYPTSPPLSNILLSKMDNSFMEWLNETGERAAYTRYADDITVSADSMRFLRDAKEVLTQRARCLAHQVNERKTKWQCASRGYRIITGVAVGSDILIATRRTRRKLRAAQHQNNKHSARGLAEWMQLKTPCSTKALRKLMDRDIFLAAMSLRGATPLVPGLVD